MGCIDSNDAFTDARLKVIIESAVFELDCKKSENILSLMLLRHLFALQGPAALRAFTDLYPESLDLHRHERAKVFDILDSAFGWLAEKNLEGIAKNSFYQIELTESKIVKDLSCLIFELIQNFKADLIVQRIISNHYPSLLIMAKDTVKSEVAYFIFVEMLKYNPQLAEVLITEKIIEQTYESIFLSANSE